MLPVGLLDILVLMRCLLGGLLHAMRHLARRIYTVRRYRLVRLMRPLIKGGVVGLELVVCILRRVMYLLLRVMLIRMLIRIRNMGEDGVLIRLLKLRVAPGIVAAIVHGLGILSLAIKP